MKCIVSAVAEQKRLRRISQLVVVMPQFMMHYGEIFFVDLNAHLQSHILLEVDVPGACMADNFTVLWLYKHRSVPKCLGQRIKADRRKESLAVANHLFRIRIARLQDLSKV